MEPFSQIVCKASQIVKLNKVISLRERARERYQGLEEELQKMWKVKATVLLLVIGVLGAVTPKLGEWLQQVPKTKLLSRRVHVCIYLYTRMYTFYL